MSRSDFDQGFDNFFGSVRRARARVANRDESGLSLPQYQLLAAFMDSDEHLVGELAAAAGVTAPTATRMLDGLERDGIVERAHSTEDRRRVTVVLTDKGRELLKTKRRNVSKVRGRMYDSLSEKEREDATRLLNRLAELMEEL